MIDVEQALAADAMSTLTSLLDHPSDKIKTLAALTIFHLRFSSFFFFNILFNALYFSILAFRFKVKNVLFKSVQSID
jgi:hypothetical protein